MESKAHFDRLEKIEKDVEVLFTNTKLKEMKKTVYLVFFICFGLLLAFAVGKPVFWALDTRYGLSSFQSRPAVLEPPTLAKPVYPGEENIAAAEVEAGTASMEEENEEGLTERDDRQEEEPDEGQTEEGEAEAQSEEVEEAPTESSETEGEGEAIPETADDAPEGESGEELVKGVAKSNEGGDEEVSSQDAQPEDQVDEAELPEPEEIGSRKLLRRRI